MSAVPCKEFLNFSEQNRCREENVIYFDNNVTTELPIIISETSQNQIAQTDLILTENVDVSDGINNQNILNKIEKRMNYRASKKNVNKYKPKPNIVLRCHICNDKFTSELRFNKHIKNHENEKPYQCEQCPESFNVVENLTLHISIHNKDQFRCPQCGKIFSRLASLEGHIKSHFKSEYFTCAMCGEMFHIAKKLQEHMNVIHSKDNYRDRTDRENKALKRRQEKGKMKTCTVCRKTFAKNFLLKRHEMIHENQKPHKCELCEQSFTQKYSLVIHQLKHTGDKPHQCSYCPQRFSQKGNLHSHIYRCHTNHPQIDSQFSCKQCSCTFRKARSLSLHVTKFHPAAVPNENNILMDDVMSQLNEIKRPDPMEFEQHSIAQQNHIVNNEMEINFQFNSAETGIVLDQLEEPEVTEKLPKLPKKTTRYLLCSYCGKSFGRPSDMIRHVRVHTKEKPYECHICHRRFNVKGTLNVHMRVHDENPFKYPCVICKRTFRNARSLDVHCQTRHANENTFPCNKCPIIFDSNNKLQSHVCSKLQLLDYPVEVPSENRIESYGNFNIESTQYMDAIDILNNSEINRQSTKQSIPPGIDLKLSCSVCSKTFTNDKMLNKHIQTHAVQKTHKCDNCPMSFVSGDLLKLHSESNHQNMIEAQSNISSIQTFENEIITIDKSTPIQLITDPGALINSNIILHNGEHVQIEGEGYFLLLTQPGDFVQFLDNQPLIENNENIHENTCNLENCEQEIIDTNANDNVQTNANGSDLNVQLQSINLLAGNSNQARWQNKELKEKVKAILRENKSPITLKNQKPRKHQCDQCEKSFLKPIDLRRHQRTHTGERPFKCTICEKQFTLLCTLNTHLITHSNKKPMLPCHICNNQFSSKCSLQVHMRIHTGLRPYKCCFCTSTFRTNGHRSRHMQFHLREANRNNIAPELIKTKKDKSKLKTILEAFRDIGKDAGIT